jgi:hypothetical protein
MDAMGDPAKPARPRSVGAVAPQEDADLDDPQFLFDETQSSAELPYTPGDLPEEEEPSSAALGEIPGRGGAAHGRSARAPDTDVTPQVPPAPPPESPTAAESSTDSDSGSWLSNDDEAIPDIRAQRDELVAQQSPTALAEPQDGFEMTSDPPERPAPEPPFPHAARVEAPRTLPREVEQPPAAAGRYAGSGGAVLVARSTPERSTREGAPVEGPRSITLDRVGALVSVLMGCALIFAGGHALLLQRRAPAGPERVRLEGGEVSSVEVLQLRDAEGHRVLAVRGLLRSSGAPPRVQLQLIDASGGPVGAPHAARPGFLGDAELTTEKLGPLLAPGERPRSTGDERGFTVLIRDPPLEAERFTLQQGA